MSMFPSLFAKNSRNRSALGFPDQQPDNNSPSAVRSPLGLPRPRESVKPPRNKLFSDPPVSDKRPGGPPLSDAFSDILDRIRQGRIGDMPMTGGPFIPNPRTGGRTFGNLFDLVPSILSKMQQQADPIEEIKAALTEQGPTSPVTLKNLVKDSLGEQTTTFNRTGLLPIVGLQRFTELHGGASPAEVENLVRGAAQGDLESAVALLGEARVREIGIENIPAVTAEMTNLINPTRDSERALGFKPTSVLKSTIASTAAALGGKAQQAVTEPREEPPGTGGPHPIPNVPTPAPDPFIPDDPRYQGNTPGYDYNRYIAAMPQPEFGVSLPYYIGGTSSGPGSTEPNAPFQQTGNQLPGTRFFSSAVANDWLGIVGPGDGLPNGGMRMEEPYVSRRANDPAYVKWAAELRKYKKAHPNEVESHVVRGDEDLLPPPEGGEVVGGTEDGVDNPPGGEDEEPAEDDLFQTIIDAFPDPIPISPGILIHQGEGDPGGIALSERTGEADRINETPGLQQPPENQHEDLTAAIKYASRSIAGNPFISIQGLARMRRGLMPLLNQIDPQFWTRTSPTIREGMLGLYKALSIREADIKHITNEFRPPGLR